jgi:hypothetical protein
VESRPEFVAVPARRCPEGVEMETRHVVTGPGLVLLVFSSVAGLVRVAGQEQPWVRVQLRDAGALQRRGRTSHPAPRTRRILTAWSHRSDTMSPACPALKMYTN